MLAQAEHRAQKPRLICQPSLDAIDQRRARHGIKIERLIAEAGIRRDTWFLARRGTRMRDGTLRRLDAALDRLIDGAPRARPPALIAAFVRVAEDLLKREIAGDTALIAALDPKRRRPAGALEPGRLRSIAVYITAVELEVGNVEIAQALGATRQNIKQLRDKIEDLRDDGRADALFTRCAALLTGRG